MNGTICDGNAGPTTIFPAQQLTFPTTGFFGNGHFVDEDSFPAFFPNGQALAYFRSRELLTANGSLPSQLSLRITSPAGESIIWADGMGTLFGFETMPDGSVIAVDLAADVMAKMATETHSTSSNCSAVPTQPSA